MSSYGKGDDAPGPVGRLTYIRNPDLAGNADLLRECIRLLAKYAGPGNSPEVDAVLEKGDDAGTPRENGADGGIFAKDAARWLRERWPHRPMTTGGLPDECLQYFQPTRKDIERWLVEYAKDAMPLGHDKK